MTTEQGYQYKSRRNCVRRIQAGDGFIVQKQYQDETSCRNELRIYNLLQGTPLACAEVLRAEDLQICMTRLPGKNLVDILEDQEQSGIIQWTIWKKLVDWLLSFHQTTGLVMTDVNLRNFLYASETDTLYGVDFEECGEGNFVSVAALLAAYIRNYAPQNTPVKQKIAGYILQEFSCRLHVPVEKLLFETEKQETLLLKRRKNRI